MADRSIWARKERCEVFTYNLNLAGTQMREIECKFSYELPYTGYQ